MIQLEQVSKVYDDGFQALKNIDLIFEEAKINVLIGPSGCGKTTTMKMLNRLTTHTGGKISIDGKDIADIDTIELRRQTGYVIQNIGLFPHMTIFENVATVPKLLKWDKDRISQRVEELLDLVNLDPEKYKDRYPSELSGGQQQRIGVIRALAAEPSTILMDEPFSALDPISREQLQDELVRLQQEIQKTIVFVTHDMDEAIKIADQIILMKDGEIVQQGTPAELLENPANDFVKEFIGLERLEQAKELPELKTFTQTDYPFVTEADSIADAIEKMIDSGASYIPVADEKQNYSGFIHLHQALKHKTGTIDELVTTNGQVFMVDTDTNQVIREMEQTNLDFVPIISQENKLVGVLDHKQLFKALHDLYESKNGGA